MKFDDIYSVSHKKTDVSQAEITQIEQHLNIKLPDDYWEFVKRFGEGAFCGVLNFFAPKQFLEHQKLCKKLWTEYYFFDKATLSQKEVLESVSVATSMDGDEVVYKPFGKIGYFVLPRHADEIQKIGKTISDVLEWFSSSGIIYKPTKFKWFSTFRDHCRLHIVKDKYIAHTEALSLIDNAFGVVHAELNEDENYSIFFCQKISGYVQIYSDLAKRDTSFDIFHDLDFDRDVYQTVERQFFKQGFRSIEHFRPKISSS